MSKLANRSIQLDEHDALVLASPLFSIARSSRQLLQLKLSPLGVIVGQDNLLTVLDMVEPKSVLAIAHELNVRPSTVSKMVDQLVLSGWTMREACMDDRRVTFVRLTAEGAEMREKVFDLGEAR